MIQIGGLQKVTLIDFPGRLAATIFLIGCNFRCPWCYSSELVLPEKIKLQPRIPEKDFFDFLKERKGLLEGVCLTGGEPTLNKDLPNFIKKIKKLGYLIKLDTNGSNPEMLKKLIGEGGKKSVAKRDSLSSLTSLTERGKAERKSRRDLHLFASLRGSSLIDYVAMDIKAPFSKYDKATGVKVNLNKIKKSIEIIKNSGVDYEFRSTIVSSIHKKEDVIEMAKWIKGAKKYYLQNFWPQKTINPKFEKIKPYPLEFLVEIRKIISPFFEVCEVRS